MRRAVALVVLGLSSAAVCAQDCGWEWVSPAPPRADLYRVLLADGTYVAVGAGGAIVTSVGGSSWHPQVSGTDADLFGVTRGFGHLVAVGHSVAADEAVVLASDDAQTWQVVHREPGARLHDVAWGAGRYVAVGSSATGGGVLVSEDGLAWRALSTGWALAASTVVWTGTVFMAGGHDLYRSADGLQWELAGSVPARGRGERLADLAWDGAQYIWAGGMYVFTSPDGVSWQERLELDGCPGASGFLGVHVTPYQLVVSGIAACPQAPLAPGQARLYASTDGGQAWERVWSAPGGGIYGVATGGWYAVAVGAGGDVLTSDDGEQWQCLPGACSSLMCADDLADVARGDHHTVAVGGVSSCMKSAKTTTQGHAAVTMNGRTWSVFGLEGSRLEGLVWDGERYLAVGGDAGNWAATSPDGSAWTFLEMESLGTPRSVAWGGEQYVAVGDHGAVSTSGDGSVWTAQPSGLTEDLKRVVANDGCFVAVGSRATIAASCDGRMWTRGDVASTENLYGLVVADGRTVAVGASGVVVTSRETDRWTVTGSGACLDLPCRLESVAWDGNLFVAVGAEWNPQRPIVAVSENAEHWTVFRPAAGGWLRQVVLSGGTITAVGNDRTILRSECVPMMIRLEIADRELIQGDRSEIVLSVSEALRRDTVVTLLSTDPAAVSVPDQATVPAWLDQVTIPIEAARPTDEVRIVATLPEERGSGSAVVALSVGHRNPAPRAPAGRLP